MGGDARTTWDGKQDNDLGNRPRGGQPLSVWTAPRGRGDIEVEREQLVAVANKLQADLNQLRRDIAAFRSANQVSAADLGISSAATAIKTSATNTHTALLTALGRLEVIYEDMIAALRGTRDGYENTEDANVQYTNTRVGI